MITSLCAPKSDAPKSAEHTLVGSARQGQAYENRTASPLDLLLRLLLSNQPELLPPLLSAYRC